MSPEFAQEPDGKFDLVTCFETLEHVPDPAATIDRLAQYVAEPGLVLMSTLLQDANFDKERLNWWYVGPRNGHISIFTKKALELLWARHGYKVVSINAGMHIAHRTLPWFVSSKPQATTQSSDQASPAA